MNCSFLIIVSLYRGKVLLSNKKNIEISTNFHVLSIIFFLQKRSISAFVNGDAGASVFDDNIDIRNTKGIKLL